MVFSIVTPTYQTPVQYLNDLYESLKKQSYKEWEWCVADGGSRAETVNTLRHIAACDKRVKVDFLPENLGIAENTRAAMALANGEWLAFLDHDDTIAPDALLDYATLVNQHPETDAIYSDEDKLSEDGRKRFDPYFKPDWSPDLFRCSNYLTHFFAVRRTLVELVGGPRDGYEGSQDYDLIFRIAEKAGIIAHVPKVHYHWRVSALSSASSMSKKDYAAEAGKRAIKDHLSRTGLRGEVELFRWRDGWQYDVKYLIDDDPLVSIVIPNRDSRATLKRCVRSLLASSWKNLEIIIVENGSKKTMMNVYKQLCALDNRIRVIFWESDFNYSAINNWAVAECRGEFVVLLNNDTEAINRDWIERMLGLCQRPEVGVVGALLCYPDRTVQHGGVFVGLGGCANHAHTGFPVDHPGYFGRLQATGNFSAVTGACMMVRRDTYLDIGGLDETLFPVAFNDIDFCLRLRKAGKLVVWTPRAKLYHFESRTRGLDDTPSKKARFEEEQERFRQRWRDILGSGDPYYNINFDSSRLCFLVSDK